MSEISDKYTTFVKSIKINNTKVETEKNTPHIFPY